MIRISFTCRMEEWEEKEEEDMERVTNFLVHSGKLINTPQGREARGVGNCSDILVHLHRTTLNGKVYARE